ncbi:hypothetical protein KAR91_53780 [Candidatus Pacearchaeota archaeon]|nr:hypothetical protein [Candidatus Pacearchaeota archaeon]
MKRLYLLICALVVGGVMDFTPVTAVEASESFGEPTEEACASCHKVAETMLADTEIGTDLGHTTKVEQEVSVAVEWPYLGYGSSETVYAEETLLYRGTYITFVVKGSSKVPI